MDKTIILVLLTALVSLHHTRVTASVVPLIVDERADDASLYYEYENDDVGLDNVYEGVELDNLHEEDIDSSDHHRERRQAGAIDLSLDHEKDGKPRPVGKPHGFLGLNGSGNNRDNHHVNLGAGVGTVAWRSRNDRHSLGVGATVDQARGRFQGHSYRSKPNVGVGVGYKFRF